MADRLAGLDAGSPASAADLAALSSAYPWAPAAYLACLRSADGLEGYVAGGGYLRLWSVASVVHFNAAYGVPEFLPSFLLFGTDASVVGYGFDERHPEQVFSIELAAMDDEYLSPIASTFGEFLDHLAVQDVPGNPKGNRHPPEWLRGHVIHEKHPVVLGGPPTDPSNRILVPAENHPELAVFFTRTLRRVRSDALRQRPGGER